MSFQTALEVALAQNFITPEMEQVISQSLWTDDITEHELNCLGILLERLERGTTQILSA